MPTILRPFAGVPRQHRQAPAARLLHHVQRSRALASLVPALIASGVLTLGMAMILAELRADIGRGAWPGSWMEIWLTSWAFAFPLAYLAMPAVKHLVARR